MDQKSRTVAMFVMLTTDGDALRKTSTFSSSSRSSEPGATGASGATAAGAGPPVDGPRDGAVESEPPMQRSGRQPAEAGATIRMSGSGCRNLPGSPSTGSGRAGGGGRPGFETAVAVGAEGDERVGRPPVGQGDEQGARTVSARRPVARFPAGTGLLRQIENVLLVKMP